MNPPANLSDEMQEETRMNPVLTVAIRYEQDIVLARQRTRQLAEVLGFHPRDQVRLATGVSEIARNAFQYARGGKVEFFITETTPQHLQIRVTDQGPGIQNLQQILDGLYTSRTGMGMGIMGTRRLMDDFKIQSTPGKGTTVRLIKEFPRKATLGQPIDVSEITRLLATQAPNDPFGEIQHQNQELLSTLSDLEKRQGELTQLNKELEDTNRGVVALYAELDEKADYLRRASELKSQFLSNMTHEFRTPLNSILSLARMLLDRVDGELSSEQQRQVKFIEKAAKDLSELVNDLLDLAKVEAGKVVIRAAEFDLNDLFGALRGMLRPLLMHNSSVTLTFEDLQSSPTLTTDESKVSQILRNLISNALKYTEKGEVRVRVTMQEDDLVEFSVSDTGVGIATADYERIFEEFTQVEGPHQIGKRGTGLGLPLSRKLAELLGGTLTVQSELNVGSVFTLRIPRVYRGLSEMVFVPDLPTEIDPTRQPVLIVEDNRETLFLYEKFLKGTGFQPIPANTVKQARQALERFRPAAIILDILLNHENAWSFLAELKGREATRDIPVFVITLVENEHKAIGLGANDFHIKPVDRHWLLTKLESLKTPNQEVLIIDDDEVSRYVLKGLLSETRFRVLESDNGLEGIELARRRRPLAIFLDLKMPDQNGFVVLNALKADDATREVPIIIHTSKELSATEEQGLHQQAIAVLHKQHSDRNASLQAVRQALAKAEAVHRKHQPLQP